jgi:MFS family permease
MTIAYGWRVLLAACFGVRAGFGSLFVYTFAVFVKPLAAQFRWNREAISLGFGLAARSVGLCSPVLGRLIDRFGPRRIILPCMTVFGCAIASLALLRPGLWQFYLTCMVIGIVGNGAAHLAYARSISTWFQKRKNSMYSKTQHPWLKVKDRNYTEAKHRQELLSPSAKRLGSG